MRKLIKLLTLCTFVAGNLNAQLVLVEGGIGAAGMNYHGDLSNHKLALSWSQVRPAVTARVGAYFNNYFGAYATVLAGSLAGDDKFQDEGTGRKERNLNFQTSILEFNLQAQGFLFPILDNNINFYGYGQVGMTLFTPRTFYQGAWVDLRPLNTEGQGLAEYPDRKPYGSSAINWGGGLGIRYYLSQRITISAEGGVRFTNTDYLDDASKTYPSTQLIEDRYGVLAASLSNRTGGTISTTIKRGNENKNDAYLVGQIVIGYRFGDQRQIRRSRAGRQGILAPWFY